MMDKETAQHLEGISINSSEEWYYVRGKHCEFRHALSNHQETIGESYPCFLPFDIASKVLAEIKRYKDKSYQEVLNYLEWLKHFYPQNTIDIDILSGKITAYQPHIKNPDMCIFSLWDWDDLPDWTIFADYKDVRKYVQ